MKRVDLGRGTIEVTGRFPKWFPVTEICHQMHNSFFSKEIRNARFPEKLNLGELTKYDGTQDRTTHLEDFDVHMSVRGLKEPIVPRIFAATLKGPALKWLHTLPFGSIHNFEDLAEAFELHFATSKRQPKSQFTYWWTASIKSPALA
ncbi:hypothetical protein K1719_014239 [Acacia pycnantha]|nr:hypothetical protein K1719_014239 [Acacia pycnantha]